jgi:DNA end-binding protein Ku
MLKPQNTHTIEIDRFVVAGQIDARYFEKPYYIVPREPIGQEAFAVIRDAMSRAGVIGLARVVLSSRERPFLIEPTGSGLRGVTLRFAHEVRSETDYFSDIADMKLPAEMMKLAHHIVRTKSGTFDPSMLEDHYRNALVRILRKKQTERPAPPVPVKPWMRSAAALRPSVLLQKPHRGEAPQNQRRSCFIKLNRGERILFTTRLAAGVPAPCAGRHKLARSCVPNFVRTRPIDAAHLTAEE